MLHHIEHDFFETGYVILRGLIENDLLDAVAVETAKPGKTIDRWDISRPITKLGYHPEILKYLENLYGYEPFPFQTLNFQNPPCVGLHTDTIHFSTLPVDWMCGVWIALEDITRNNGPLIYFPGSHKLPFFDFEDLGMTPSMDYEKFMKNLGRYSEWLGERAKTMRAEQLICNRGTIIVWHANLMHCSAQPKNKNVSRSSQVTHYYFRYPDVKFTLPSQGKGFPKSNVFAMEERAKEWRII